MYLPLSYHVTPHIPWIALYQCLSITATFSKFCTKTLNNQGHWGQVNEAESDVKKDGNSVPNNKLYKCIVFHIHHDATLHLRNLILKADYWINSAGGKPAAMFNLSKSACISDNKGQACLGVAVSEEKYERKAEDTRNGVKDALKWF